METQEIIKEVKAIRQDLIDRKINYTDSIGMIKTLSKHTNIDFIVLYNAFFSSTPEIYLEVNK